VATINSNRKQSEGLDISISVRDCTNRTFAKKPESNGYCGWISRKGVQRLRNKEKG
jgi:hypothetical protein